MWLVSLDIKFLEKIRTFCIKKPGRRPDNLYNNFREKTAKTMLTTSLAILLVNLAYQHSCYLHFN